MSRIKEHFHEQLNRMEEQIKASNEKYKIIIPVFESNGKIDIKRLQEDIINNIQALIPCKYRVKAEITNTLK